MSGIVGIISTGAGVDRALLSRLTDSLSFRGPDGRSVWCCDAAGFGRSWFDTAREGPGRQPPFTLDRKTYVVADARIDGRAELLRRLRDAGAVVETDAGDAELLLHAYRAWGEDCVAHLLGDFAFAVWDEPLQQLFAARDHFGVKPFFYALTSDGLLFGNTLNCLRRHPEVSARLNELAVADHLLFGFNQDTTTTTFADVRRLPATHTLTWAQGRLRTRCYWSLPTDGSFRCRDGHEVVERFRDHLRTAVADRLPAGNVAINMSGGLDSTSVAALAKDVLAERSRPDALHAFTVVYDRLIPDEERHYSGVAAQALGVPVQYLAADDYRPFQDTRTGERHFPEPTDDPLTAVFTDHLRRAAGHGRVVLSGDGGDAVLRGSQAYLMNMLRRCQWGRWLGEVTRYVGAHRRPPPLGLRSWVKRVIGLGPAPQPFPTWLNPDFVRRLNLRERWREITCGGRDAAPTPAHPTHAEAQRLLSAPYWPWLFEGCNPGTTSISLEFRYPFFDVRLIDFVLAISPLPWCADKWVLRAAMRNRLPDAIRLRPKRPLAGNPLESLSCLDFLEWPGSVGDMRQVAPYVSNEGIRQSADSQGPHSLLTRPISLAYWLDHLIPANTVLERETHHHEYAQSDAETSLPITPPPGLRHGP
jgi:asparagine synthase (glutamine-hydrolysing)